FASPPSVACDCLFVAVYLNWHEVIPARYILDGSACLRRGLEIGKVLRASGWSHRQIKTLRLRRGLLWQSVQGETEGLWTSFLLLSAIRSEFSAKRSLCLLTITGA